jgi:hypothetical protein
MSDTQSDINERLQICYKVSREAREADRKEEKEWRKALLTAFLDFGRRGHLDAQLMSDLEGLVDPLPLEE